jgi:WhiB family redox-sensing transcriptional regulator
MALRDDHDSQSGRGASDPLAWQMRAACRGQSAASFFPPLQFEPKDLRVSRERAAKSVCRTCPVADECLDYALRTREPHGVWGGLNEVERRGLLQRDRGR